PVLRDSATSDSSVTTKTRSAPIAGSNVVARLTSHSCAPRSRSYAASFSPSSANTAKLSRNAGGAVSALLSANVQIGATGKCERAVFDVGTPVLGICYGMQLMADTLGGKVAPAAQREFGHATVTLQQDFALFEGVPQEVRVWASHGDFVASAPAGFSVVATS